MNKRIPKSFIYVFILIAVLGIGIWIGKSGIGPSISEKILQTADGGENVKNDVLNENESDDSDEQEDNAQISPPDINSIRSAKAIRVIDGDTIEIEDGQRIRYLGINAPESGQPFSTEASRENERLVAGRAVNLEFDIQTQDRYGRLLAYVWAGDVLVNKAIVKNGYAVSETIQPNVKYQDLIVNAQQEAREDCRGLWTDLCSKKSEISCVKIININADAPGNDNENKNGEWIEIKNTCDTAILMKDWLLKDSSASNKYKFQNFFLKGFESMIIYSGCGNDTQNKLYWQCPEGRYAIWNNNGDHAFLYDAGGNLITEYQY